MIWQFEPPSLKKWIEHDDNAIAATESSSDTKHAANRRRFYSLSKKTNRRHAVRIKKPLVRKTVLKLAKNKRLLHRTLYSKKTVRRRKSSFRPRRARSSSAVAERQHRLRRRQRSTSSFCIGSNDGCTRYRLQQPQQHRRPSSATIPPKSRTKPSNIRQFERRRVAPKRHDSPPTASSSSMGEKAAHATASNSSIIKPYGTDESREVDRSLCNYTWVSTVKPVLPSDDVYRMLSWPRGYVLIINNKYFAAEELWTRTGSEVDVLRMRLTFEMLGFKIFRNKTYHDLTAKQADKLLSEFATYEGHRRCDCLAVVTMSHGSKTKGLYFRNGDSIKPEDIQEKFIGEHCPAMRNKPKIFIMNHCRGVALDGGTAHTSSRPTPQLAKHLRSTSTSSAARRRRQKVVSDDDESCKPLADADCNNNTPNLQTIPTARPLKKLRFADQLVVELDKSFRIEEPSLTSSNQDDEENCDEPPPINGQADCDISLGCIGYKTPDNKIARYSDMIIVYSTTLGYVGLRSRELGCFFFDCLANLTAQMSHKEHLIDILTKVNSMQGHFALQVNGEYKYQQSEIVSRLHKKLYFNPGIRERGVSISQSPSAADEDAAASTGGCGSHNKKMLSSDDDDDDDSEDESGEDNSDEEDDDCDGRRRWPKMNH